MNELSKNPGNESEQSFIIGKKIVVTRPAQQAESFVERVQQYGAKPIVCPLIETKMVEDVSALDKAIKNISKYTLIVFTSTNSVDYFIQRAEQLSESIERLFRYITIVAVGPKTAQRIESYGLNVELFPETYDQEGLIKCVLEYMSFHSLVHSRILYPRAKKVRPLLTAELCQHGYRVDEIITYETKLVHTHLDLIWPSIVSGELDVLTFTSSSTVDSFASYVNKLTQSAHYDDRVANVKLASIGPVTAETLRHYGLPVHIEASTYTVDGLLEAINAHYKNDS